MCSLFIILLIKWNFFAPQFAVNKVNEHLLIIEEKIIPGGFRKFSKITKAKSCKISFKKRRKKNTAKRWPSLGE